MDSSQPDIREEAKKIVIWLLVAILWLTTVALGLAGVFLLQDTVYILTNLFVVRSIDNQTMGISTGSGLERLLQYVTVFISVPLWIGLAIFGLEFHFKPKNIGRRKSYRILAWTIGIEIALIVICLLLQNAG
jgi:hypothetical protein